MVITGIIIFSTCYSAKKTELVNEQTEEIEQLRENLKLAEQEISQLLWWPCPEKTDTLKLIIYRDKIVKVVEVKNECPPGVLEKHKDEIAELKRDAKELFAECSEYKEFYLQWKNEPLQQVLDNSFLPSQVIPFTKQFQGYTFFFTPRIRGELLSFDMKVSPVLSPPIFIEEEELNQTDMLYPSNFGASAGFTFIDQFYFTQGLEYGQKNWALVGQTHIPVSGGKIGFSVLGKYEFQF